MSCDKTLEAHFSGLSVEQPPKKFKPVKVTRNADMIKKFLHLATGEKSWSYANCSYPYDLVRVKRNSAQFKAVRSAFNETNEYYYIIGIDRVVNPFLLAQYLLKEAYKKSLKPSTKTQKLFHGTKEEHIDSICKTNLDWRWMGSSGFRGNKYGNGVSFSPSSSYASMFPRGDYFFPRVMFLCNVLLHDTTLGNTNVNVPADGADASKSADGKVIVKYDDNEFYPMYVIYYEEFNDFYY